MITNDQTGHILRLIYAQISRVARSTRPITANKLCDVMRKPPPIAVYQRQPRRNSGNSIDVRPFRCGDASLIADDSFPFHFLGTLLLLVVYKPQRAESIASFESTAFLQQSTNSSQLIKRITRLVGFYRHHLNIVGLFHLSNVLFF